MKSLVKALTFIFLSCLCSRGMGQNNQTVTSGATVPPININGTGCSYSWINDNPAIGLPGNGTGNIPSFTAANTTGKSITANITVIPPPSGYTYIANFGSNSVSVIDNVTNLVVATIPVGKNPTATVVTPDGKQVYVANDNDYTVSVINTAINQVVKTIYVGDIPQQLAISPDGSKIYVPLPITNNITVISTATNSIAGVLPCLPNPYMVAISPDGSFLYTSYGDNNNVITVLDLNTVQFGPSISTGKGYYGLAVSPDNKTLYAANYDQYCFAAIDVVSHSVRTVPVTGAPFNIALNSDGSRIYVPGSWNDVTSVFNTANYQLLAVIPGLQAVKGVCISPDDSRAYVVNGASDTVSVIGTATNTVIAQIPVQHLPESFNNFVFGSSACKQHTFTITVNANFAPVVTTSTVTGSILGCVGSPGESPNVGQFTIAGTSLTGDITVTPPAGFDISLTAIGGYSPSLVLKQAGGAVISTTIYVRSSASDPVGPVSGNVQITTPGATPDQVAVTGNVHALPTVDPVPNFVYNNGDLTTPINFTGNANYFIPTNNNPAIGLPTPGDGDIGSFIATNTGNTPLIATVTVTPYYRPVAYIANNRSNNVSLVNFENGTLMGTVGLTPTTINVGQGPWGVSLSPDYSKVYISNNVSGTVSVINTSSNAVTATITVGSDPEGVLVSRDGNNVYVANEASGTVSVINTLSNIVTATIHVGANPTQLAASPDGKTIYVSNHDARGTISVINTAGNTVAATIGSLNYPTGLAISPDGSKLYVASDIQNNVTVINTANYSVITTIPTGAGSTGMAMTPDGSKLYVSNSGAVYLSVINTATNTVSGTIGGGPGGGVILSGICVSPDGNFVCVTDAGHNDIALINTSTNAVTGTSVGNYPLSFGNFMMPAALCSGTPTTFTITVNPSPPAIKAEPASGTISACTGTPSAKPDIQQFTMSGSGLTGDLTAAAPAGFEISFTPDGGYVSSLTIPQLGGTVNNVTVYVRSSASDAGSIPGNVVSGNITLSSPGAADQTVAVTATVYAGPTMDQPASQTVASGQATAPVNFTGTTAAYMWTNDTPGIGLPASGTDNIASFTATNPGPNPVMATITVIPLSMSGIACNGTPTTFTITVSPPPPPVITSSGTLTGLSTIYGIASSSESLTVSATNATAGILVTAPQGFEVSTDNQTFSTTVTAGQAGAISAVPVYIRLAATTVVGNYSGNIVLSIAAAPDVNVNMPLSSVEKTILTVTAPDVTRTYGVPNPAFVPQYLGFVNGDNQSNLTTLPDLTTTATITSPPGNYPIQVIGGSSPNYIINPVGGTLTITPSPSEIVVPNAFTPNGDGINDFWDIKTLVDFPQCLVSVYTRYGSLVFQSRGYPKPWDGTSNGSPVPTGTYYYIINPNQPGFGLLSGFVAVLR